MMNDGTFSAPVELATSRFSERDLSAAGLTHRAQIVPQKPTGLWIRQLIEERPEFLTQIVRQQCGYGGEQANCFMILCGAGHDILVMVNDTPWPVDVNVVPRINLSLCLTTSTIDNPMDDVIHQHGSIDPSDELWMHMMLAVRAGVFPGCFRIYLATSLDGPTYRPPFVAAKVILRIRMDKKGHVSKVSRVSPQDAPSSLFHFSSGENYTIKNRPNRKRAATPSTTVTQTKKPKNSSKVSNAQQNVVRNSEVATAVPPKKGPTKDTPGQKAISKKSHTAKVPARNLHGFSLEECEILEHAYEAMMTQPDTHKPKDYLKPPVIDSVAAVPSPVNTAKGLAAGKKVTKSSNPASLSSKVNGDTENSDHNLYGFSQNELVMLEKAYESVISSSSNTAEGIVPHEKILAVRKLQPKTPRQVVKPKALLSLPVTTEVVENQKLCFYYPFCTKLSSECGGKQRGRCREVKAGNVALPKDEQEFRQVKKKALRALKRQRKKDAVPEV